MSFIGKFTTIAFQLAASRFGGWIVRAGIFFMERFQPGKVIYSGQLWIAFEHPQPAYPLHILLVPRQNVPNLMDADARNPALLGELVAAVQQLVNSYGLAGRGYRMICNGGEYQQVPHLHFHLISG